MQTVKSSWSYKNYGITLFIHRFRNDNNPTRNTASSEISKFVNSATLLNLVAEFVNLTSPAPIRVYLVNEVFGLELGQTSLQVLSEQ